ncbi:hypothetical protein BB560_006946 [Smittium megazygosporum]|uniref:AB hydrolase-1 domain-containing protein n=1 Tax=Smittium megazygosporum TaxID=133381 RepID=A0A2T9Y030_9FUNG|nr:hypothetical protein BB560_006946 [Smittium megazygosporum]
MNSTKLLSSIPKRLAPFGLPSSRRAIFKSNFHSSRRVLSEASFPCIDRIEHRELLIKSHFNNDENLYKKVVDGYETFHYEKPFVLSHGGILPSFKLAYETWGTLNKDKSNAILLHTGLSASSHAKSHEKNSKPGWWEKFIGPGLPIDTNKYFVICTNVLGGCYGSTGPSSYNPLTGKRYATSFPILTIFDMVRSQFHLVESMGISKLYASVGASMGGMQSLAAAALFPEKVGKLISISACAISHPYSISLRYSQRQVLMTDPNFSHGNYYDKVIPHVGLKLARLISTITYRSGPEWESRFGRDRASPRSNPMLCPDYKIETYLDHKSEKFCFEYDANSLIYISKATDMFDMTLSKQKSLEERRVHSTELLESKGSSPDELYEFLTRSKLGLYNINDNFVSAEPIKQDLNYEKYLDSSNRLLNDLIAGLKNVQMPTLVLGVQSDILFPSAQQKEIANALRLAGNKQVTYYELDSIFGHDTFLLDIANVGAAVKGHLDHPVN